MRYWKRSRKWGGKQYLLTDDDITEYRWLVNDYVPDDNMAMWIEFSTCIAADFIEISKEEMFLEML